LTLKHHVDKDKVSTYIICLVSGLAVCCWFRDAWHNAGNTTSLCLWCWLCRDIWNQPNTSLSLSVVHGNLTTACQWYIALSCTCFTSQSGLATSSALRHMDIRMETLRSPRYLVDYCMPVS